MSIYFQPLINFGPYPSKGSIFLADPTFWFDKVKVLERDKTPQIVRVKDIPKRVINDNSIITRGKSMKQPERPSFLKLISRSFLKVL